MEKENIQDALIPVYIMSENENEIAFVADNVVEGMYDPSDRDRMNIYREGFQWIKDSDNEEAIQNLVDSFVQLGIQYAEYGYDQVAIQVLGLVLEVKKTSESENKDKLVQIVEERIGRLQ